MGLFSFKEKIKGLIKRVLHELIDDGELTEIVVKAGKKLTEDVELGYSSDRGVYIEKKVKF